MATIQPFTNLSGNIFNLIKPFFNGKTRDISNVDTVVLHWTAGANLSSDITTLKSKNYGYHFLIDKSGQIYQGSALNKKLSHSGHSYGPQGNFVNGHSIGISFSMRGILSDGTEDEFTDAMYTSCINLIKDIKLGVPTLKYITGHHWISPGRKIDPYTLDFNRLMGGIGNGFELWKTGDSPFPEGLSDNFVGAGDYKYSIDALSTVVRSEFFQSDLETE
tara:strand:+ start:4120 stop:4776 length:657 start_codon:yes stop_codon:yes gene_type:complete